MLSIVIIAIIAIFLPPVAVFIMKGCGADLCINILLTILGYFPGHIHAFWLLFKENEDRKNNAPLVIVNKNVDPERDAAMAQSNVAYPATGQTVGRT